MQQLAVRQAGLWGPADPYMYKVRSTVREGGSVDRTSTTPPIGIREAVFDADKGFLLNGERVKLNGVCLHHDAGAVGAAVPERVWERRLELLREMGCNAIRTSHNPYAAEFMDLCDRMGFLRDERGLRRVEGRQGPDRPLRLRHLFRRLASSAT